MAARSVHYGRRLVVFGVIIAVLYALVALTAEWKPKLGLDLQGGTRISLQAKTENGENPPSDQMQEARGIIDQRVNGTGVSEAEVSVQGGRNIVVEIPGQNRTDIVDTIARSAQLYFRLVADVPTQYMTAPSTGDSGTKEKGTGKKNSDKKNSDKKNSDKKSSGKKNKAKTDGTKKSSASKKNSAGKKNSAAKKNAGKKNAAGRAVSGGLLRADETPAASPSASASKSPSTSPSKAASQTPSASASPTTQPTTEPTTTAEGAEASDYMAWQSNPGTAWLQKYQAYECPATGETDPDLVDNPEKPLITCDEDGNKFLLSVAVIDGKDLKSASYGTPQNATGWVVDLSFNSKASKTFADVTRDINQAYNANGSQKAFAIVLDGQVLQTPTVSNGAITGGSAQISGNFTEDSARSLATSLNYGSLPLQFEVGETSNEGPTLASDQLTAGLWAGGIGLLVVMLYCLLYYRGLGLVVVASLIVAAVMTYAIVLLLSEAADFTLTLPGIAGLIVAVGITADSFIVYFERIRDEMREGKSMRVAVETGWVRARNTCLAADAVSLLAAVVLYIFAIGVVKGFAFALGVSTLIDLAVFFMFTKPMVSWLAQFKFFNSGHRLSGLSPETIGIERIGSAAPAGAATAGRRA
ncbi:MAG: protein translocase subunit SecD [Nocardioidaceae bacterium]